MKKIETGLLRNPKSAKNKYEFQSGPEQIETGFGHEIWNPDNLDTGFKYEIQNPVKLEPGFGLKTIFLNLKPVKKITIFLTGNPNKNIMHLCLFLITVKR